MNRNPRALRAQKKADGVTATAAIVFLLCLIRDEPVGGSLDRRYDLRTKNFVRSTFIIENRRARRASQNAKTRVPAPGRVATVENSFGAKNRVG